MSDYPERQTAYEPTTICDRYGHCGLQYSDYGHPVAGDRCKVMVGPEPQKRQECGGLILATRNEAPGEPTPPNVTKNMQVRGGALSGSERNRRHRQRKMRRGIERALHD